MFRYSTLKAGEAVVYHALLSHFLGLADRPQNAHLSEVVARPSCEEHDSFSVLLKRNNLPLKNLIKIELKTERDALDW